MKTLQNNFTTPEQSKRLLDLGVPADSADVFYSHHIKTYPHSEYTEIKWIRPRFITEDNNPNWNARLIDSTRTYFPCWSVGRLIEIYATCTGCGLLQLPLDDSLIDTLIDGIEWNRLDFSKLEE